MIRFAGSPPYFAAARPAARTHFGNVTELNPQAARAAMTTLLEGLQYASQPQSQKSSVFEITVKDSNDKLYTVKNYLNGTTIELIPRGGNGTPLLKTTTGQFNQLTYTMDGQNYDFTEFKGKASEYNTYYADDAFCKDIHEKLAALFPAN
jgi:hypothetical protein